MDSIYDMKFGFSQDDDAIPGKAKWAQLKDPDCKEDIDEGMLEQMDDDEEFAKGLVEDTFPMDDSALARAVANFQESPEAELSYDREQESSVDPILHSPKYGELPVMHRAVVDLNGHEIRREAFETGWRKLTHTWFKSHDMKDKVVFLSAGNLVDGAIQGRHATVTMVGEGVLGLSVPGFGVAVAYADCHQFCADGLIVYRQREENEPVYTRAQVNAWVQEQSADVLDLGVLPEGAFFQLALMKRKLKDNLVSGKIPQGILFLQDLTRFGNLDIGVYFISPGGKRVKMNTTIPKDLKNLDKLADKLIKEAKNDKWGVMDGDDEDNEEEEDW